MAEISYRRHRFPPAVIQHAVCFTLSYRDVEDLLAERGLDISYETVRSWVLKFGPVIARRLRPRPSPKLFGKPGSAAPLVTRGEIK
jgi:putative transposase